MYEGMGNKLPKMKIPVVERIKLKNGDNVDLKPVFKEQLKYINASVEEKKSFSKWS